VRLYLVWRYIELRYIGFVPELSSQAFHILIALADRDQHGYGIMLDVAERTRGKLRLSPGTLYGSIKRLLEQGFITELNPAQRPMDGHDDERRRYYRLTPLGRKAAKQEVKRMSALLEQAKAHGLADQSN
jgi:DNA-binding PadR family transcriptional regulator